MVRFMLVLSLVLVIPAGTMALLYHLNLLVHIMLFVVPLLILIRIVVCFLLLLIIVVLLHVGILALLYGKKIIVEDPAKSSTIITEKECIE